MRYDLKQPPREVTATLWLVTKEGERVESKPCRVRITHNYWYGMKSEYYFDTLEPIDFEIKKHGHYMAMVMIEDEQLGEFWVNMKGGPLECKPDDHLSVSASAQPSGVSLSGVSL